MDALWVMDDDTIPERAALECLVQADENLQGDYGWLSSRALAPDGTDQADEPPAGHALPGYPRLRGN